MISHGTHCRDTTAVLSDAIAFTCACACEGCAAERTRRGQVRTPPALVATRETVGTAARSGEGTNGDLTISLSDAAFLAALGVVLTLAVELAAFVAWAGAQ